MTLSIGYLEWLQLYHIFFSSHTHIASAIDTPTSHFCFMHIRQQRRIRPMLDFKTPSTIATSVIHSKLDYCNSLFLNLEFFQIKRLQLIQNPLARALFRTPRHHYIPPVLKSLHWLAIQERIHFNVLSPTCNSYSPQCSKPTCIPSRTLQHPANPLYLQGLPSISVFSSHVLQAEERADDRLL